MSGVPPMPAGFADRTAWDAIHWRFSDKGSTLDDAMISWQRENQGRMEAAQVARSNDLADRLDWELANRSQS